MSSMPGGSGAATTGAGAGVETGAAGASGGGAGSAEATSSRAGGGALDVSCCEQAVSRSAVSAAAANADEVNFMVCGQPDFRPGTNMASALNTAKNRTKTRAMPAGLSVSRYQAVAIVVGIAPAVATPCFTAKSVGLAISAPQVFAGRITCQKMRQRVIRRNDANAPVSAMLAIA
jgi:hypothetical protein